MGRDQLISALIGLCVPMPLMAGLAYWLLHTDAALPRHEEPAARPSVRHVAMASPMPQPTPTPTLAPPRPTPTPMATPRSTPAPARQVTPAPALSPIMASDDFELDGHAWRRLAETERVRHAEALFKAYMTLGHGHFTEAPPEIQDATVRATIRAGKLVDEVSRFYEQNPSLLGRPARQVVQDLGQETKQRYLRSRP